MLNKRYAREGQGSGRGGEVERWRDGEAGAETGELAESSCVPNSDAVHEKCKSPELEEKKKKRKEKETLRQPGLRNSHKGKRKHNLSMTV